MSTKRQSQTAEIAAMKMEIQKTFGLLLQLSQEVQQIGGMMQTAVAILQEMDGYDAAVDSFEAKKLAATQSTPETSVTPLVDDTDHLIFED